MIILRKLNGSEFALNSDLIETVEEAPDTTIRMNDKHIYIVKESLREVVDLIVEHKRRCLNPEVRTNPEDRINGED